MDSLSDSPSIAAPTRLRTDTLADSVLILLTLTGMQRVVGFCRAVLFCRWLDPDQLGRWDMAFSFLLLAAPLSVLALSSSFGRYLEYYRQRSQLRTFLRRTALACTVLGGLAAAAMHLAPGLFSRLIFGTPEYRQLVGLLAVSLLAMIAMNYFIDLFNALRNARLIAGLQLLHSLAFAGLGVALVLAWQATASSVVIAHAAACLLACIWGGWWLWRHRGALGQDGPRCSHRELWFKLIPFTSWIWLTSLLSNLFDVADRYMLLHYSGLGSKEALALVGDYHSSRIVPLLLVSVAVLLGSLLTPHLSHDWEEGNRQRVASRLNLFLKLVGIALSAGAALILLGAPLLFGVAFRGKFAGGQAVLPLTLTYCTWFGLSIISQNYLWCAEKARLATVALLVGLGLNVALNLVLVPRLALYGAVLATTAANLVALLLVTAFNGLLGFRVDRGTAIVLALPAVNCLGPFVALAVLAGVALEAFTTDRIFSPEEKQQIAQGSQRYWERLQRLRPAPKSAGF